MKHIPRSLFGTVTLLVPSLAFAQTANNLGGLNRVFLSATDFISSTLLPLVFALAVFVFCYGIFRYFIAGADNQEARESGKALMVWGVLGLVLIVAIWGVVNFILDSFVSSLGEGPTTGF